MRTILGYVNYNTAQADEAVLALGHNDKERRLAFIAYYKRLFFEIPNFESYFKALGQVCTPHERHRLFVNLWAALEEEKLDGKSVIMDRLLKMQACDERSLAKFVRGKPKTIKACLDYLELLL